MGKKKVKIAEKLFVDTSTEIFSDLLSTITPNDLRKYIQLKRDKQRIMKDIPLSRLFFLFERENLLNAITHQVHLSEAIELIAGTIVSDDLKRFRGLLLNIERASIYFYIYYWIFRFLNNFKVSRLALESYNSFRFLFEQIWKIKYPWNLIRPEGIFDPITLTQIPEIQKIVTALQKNAWNIANTIEKRTTVKNILEEVENISLGMVKKTGITGPVVRTLGTVTSQITPSTPSTRQSAQIFLKYTYTTESNLLNVLRVSYTELILSLNQFSHLLKGYIIVPQGTLNSLDGEATTSFTTTLGESHLTLNILENQVKYFNFIPPQMANITGVVESLSICPSSLQSIIILLFDPEFLLYLE